jgi:hypothetical protein
VERFDLGFFLLLLLSLEQLLVPGRPGLLCLGLPDLALAALLGLAGQPLAEGGLRLSFGLFPGGLLTLPLGGFFGLAGRGASLLFGPGGDERRVGLCGQGLQRQGLPLLLPLELLLHLFSGLAW